MARRQTLDQAEEHRDKARAANDSKDPPEPRRGFAMPLSTEKVTLNACVDPQWPWRAPSGRCLLRSTGM